MTATITATPDNTLRLELKKTLAFNAGITPVRLPKDIEEIRLLRIFINVLRQAEDDYLTQNKPSPEFAQAEQTLFGIHHSPLPGVCRVLGIDYHAARIKLIEWKIKGLKGDPIFDCLTKPGALDQYEKGYGINAPKLGV